MPDRWTILSARLGAKQRRRPPPPLIGRLAAAEAEVVARAGTAPGQAMAAWQAAEPPPGWLQSVRSITFSHGVLHVRFADAAAHQRAFHDLRSGPLLEAAQRATKYQIRRIRTSL